MHYSNPKVKWNDIAAWGEGKSLRVVICKLAIWVFVYHVWRQKKNAIVHQNNNGSVIVPSQTWLFEKTPPNEWAKVEKWESPLV